MVGENQVDQSSVALSCPRAISLIELELLELLAMTPSVSCVMRGFDPVRDAFAILDVATDYDDTRNA
eukprot:6367572-Amphidinium_carterae.1